MSKPVDNRADRAEFIEERFLRHIEKLAADGFTLRCPTCGNTTFTVQHTEVAGAWEESLIESQFNPNPVLPRLPIVCRRCFYLMEFAWTAIRMTTERE